MFLSDKQRKFLFANNFSKFSVANSGIIDGTNRSGIAMLARATTDNDKVGQMLNSDRVVECEKYDGIRTFVVINNNKVEMFNPRHVPTDYSNKFPEIVPELISRFTDSQPVILDGELRYQTDGKDDVHRVTARLNMTDEKKVISDVSSHPMQYVAFDIIELSDDNIADVPLETRLGILDNAIGDDSNHVIKGKCVYDDKIDFLNNTLSSGKEGVVLKDLDSGYEFGERSGSWTKVKNKDSDTFIVYGVERGSGKNSDKLGSLLIGKFDDGKFVEVGSVGSGITQEQRKDVWDKYGSSEGNKIILPESERFEADISYLESDTKGGLRHPRLDRLREDISIGEI